MTNEIIQHQDNQQAQFTLSISQLKERVKLIHEAVREIMKVNEDYGIIPGCGNKKVLLKAGAEKLCLLFRFSPSFEITEEILAENNRGYKVTTTLTHIGTNENLGQGVGSCSTLETKYHKRKNGSINLDPQNDYNTVLKMAKKRSLIDAVLTATGTSSLFTQDLDERRSDEEENNETIQPKPEQPKPIKAQQTQVKYASLQPKHEAVYNDFCEKITNATDDTIRTEIYEKAKSVFEGSTSLTEECIKNVLSGLKSLYDFCQEPQKEEPNDETK